MTKFNPYDASNTSETVEQEIKRRKDNTPDELATLRARIADLEAAGDAIRDEYIYTTRRDDIDEDLLMEWFHAKGGE